MSIIGWAFIGVIGVSQLLVFTLLVKANLRREPKRQDLMITVMQQNERLLDRLMAKNLREYASHAQQNGGPDLVSHPRNDEIEAAMEENRNIAERAALRASLGI